MQLLSTERADKNRDQLNLQETVSELQQSLQSEQQAAEGKVWYFSCVVVTYVWSPAWTFAGVDLWGFWR